MHSEWVYHPRWGSVPGPRMVLPAYALSDSIDQLETSQS